MSRNAPEVSLLGSEASGSTTLSYSTSQGLTSASLQMVSRYRYFSFSSSVKPLYTCNLKLVMGLPVGEFSSFNLLHGCCMLLSFPSSFKLLHTPDIPYYVTFYGRLTFWCICLNICTVLRSTFMECFMQYMLEKMYLQQHTGSKVHPHYIQFTRYCLIYQNV